MRIRNKGKREGISKEKISKEKATRKV